MGSIAGVLRYCRAGCPRPTEVPLGDIPPRLSECCRMLTAGCGHPALQQNRGRFANHVGGGVYDAPFQRAVPQGRDSPQRGEMSPQGDREEGGHFLALCAHSVDKRQPLQVLPRPLAIHRHAAQHTFLSCPLHLPQCLAELESEQNGGEQHR